MPNDNSSSASQGAQDMEGEDRTMLSPSSMLRLAVHVPYASTVALTLGADAQVNRLKKLMVQAIERRDRSHWLCRIGMHSMAWKVEVHIGRKLGLPSSRYQLYYFQLGFCRWCGRGKQRWIGEAPMVTPGHD